MTTIQLTESDIKLINKALDCYEAEVTSSALLTSMLGTMLCPKDQREAEEVRFKTRMEEAEVQRLSRRNQTILLRAKIVQADNRLSEHTS